MSTTEILQELPRLARADREKVWQRLEEIELGEIEESPEALEAIDDGRRNMRNGQESSVEDARKLVAQWITMLS